jgi:hypothetical protein
VTIADRSWALISVSQDNGPTDFTAGEGGRVAITSMSRNGS